MINKEKKIVFLHLSKTGGIWANSILEHYDFEIINLKKNGGHLPNSAKYNDHFTFGFIRHPVAWYKSLYRFFKTNNWVLQSGGNFTDLKSDNINEFLAIIKSRNRFDLIQMYDEFFVKHPVSYIGKYENLYDDLDLCLRLNGVDATDLIKEKSRAIINKSEKYDCDISQDNLNHIFDYCDKMFDKFNYKKENVE